MREAFDRASGGPRVVRGGELVWQAALVALVGCGGPDVVDWRDPNALPINGVNVTLYYDRGAMPCAGTLPYLDASAAAVASYLDVPLGEPIPYYYTQDLRPCSPDTLGCTVGPPAATLSCWGTRPDMVHELVHAVEWRGRGLSKMFLEEGLAVALGELDSVGIANAGASDEDLLMPQKLPAEDFGLAGDFVSYLLTRFGPALFQDLLASVRPTDTVDEVEAAFADVYGETMAALRADRSQSPLTFYGNRIDVPECQGLELDPRLGQGATVTETIDCATNAVGVAGASVKYVAFEIAADGIYEVRVDSAAAFGLYTCGGGAALISPHLSGAKPLVVGYFHAGRYFFTLGAASAAPEMVSVTLVPAMLGTWPSCSSITPIAVPPGTDYVYLFSMDDGALQVPFVLGDAAILVGIHAVVNQTLNHAQICTRGCGTSCTNADSIFNPPKLPAGATFTLQATFAGQPKLVGENLQAP